MSTSFSSPAGRLREGFGAPAERAARRHDDRNPKTLPIGGGGVAVGKG